MPEGVYAFTETHDRLARILQSKAHIGIAFDPSNSPAPPLLEVNAIWDTGATGCVITRRVVEECKLRPIAMTKVHTVGGTTVSPVYLVSIRLPNGIGFPAVQVTEGNIGDVDILIGMDLINQGDFAVTNIHGKTTFSFRIPSTTRIDFVAQAKRDDEPGRKKLNRNDPCPCGSGKKYKKCCGRNTT